MATTPTAPTLRALYRSLLRELPSRPAPITAHPPLAQGMIRRNVPRTAGHSLLSTRTPLHARIRSQFSPPATGQAAAGTAGQAGAAPRQLQEGRQFVAYLKAQRVYTTLLERYNPGMGMDEAERVRLSARKVGMDLPPEYAEEEEGAERK